MPKPPTQYRIHPAAHTDLETIKRHNPDHAKRCFDRIEDWERKIQWGRIPQTHMTSLTTSDSNNWYREWIGQSGYRIIYEISNDIMTVVAVLPKTDSTYDLDEFERRMDQYSE